MKAFILPTLLLVYSCSKNTTLSKDAMGTHINGLILPVNRVEEIEWLVGKGRRKEVVTQSFVFSLSAPKLSIDDLEFLTEQKGIDSWIFRIIFERGSDRRDLGSILVPFRSSKKGRGQATGQSSGLSVKIFYAAAYASERFRRFSCPAFGHQFKIKKISIMGEELPFDLTLGPITSYNEKPQMLELNPNAFNGGHSLQGNYYVEFAPYDSARKNIHSIFKRIPQFIQVEAEEKIDVESCRGERPELTPAER